MFQYITDDIEISSDSGREETFNEKKFSKKCFLHVKNDR